MQRYLWKSLIKKRLKRMLTINLFKRLTTFLLNRQIEKKKNQMIVIQSQIITKDITTVDKKVHLNMLQLVEYLMEAG